MREGKEKREEGGGKGRIGERGEERGGDERREKKREEGGGKGRKE